MERIDIGKETITMYRIHRAPPDELRPLTSLVLRLWPEHKAEELAEEYRLLLSETDCAIFLAAGEDTPVGFAQCQLRRDYVEGTETSPVGYLEGIYVLPEYRGSGLARALLNACENWAREQNCQEFASDCELDNHQSLAFHLHVGFQEANRIICFRKDL